MTNGTIVTMDAQRPTASTLGIWQGRVVGLDEAVADLPAVREVDLDGATVLPGFVDAHVHLAWAGLKARTASVASADRIEDVLAIIEQAARNQPGGAWVDVVGYDQRLLGRHLTATELDTVTAGRKLLLTHNSGHACVVNSAVLELLPPGVHHDAGVLAEQDMAAVRRLRLPYAVDELVAAIEHTSQACLAEGVTTVAEAGIGGGLVEHSPIELSAHQTAREQGRLPIRVQLMVAADALHEVGAHDTDDVPRGIDLGLRTGLGDDWLSIGALKVFTDGGMMPRTAALSEPYEGTDETGRFYADPELLERQIVDGHQAGWQLAIHAIGDRAVDLALDALARARRLRPRPDARHRIEHAGLVRPEQLSRFAELGAIAVVQPNFLWYLGDDYAEIMGPKRAPWLYRGDSFTRHGVRLVGSSDRPVTNGAPLRAVQFMVERQSMSGQPIGPDEAITVDAALRAYTLDAAYACHRERTLGSLTPGKWADFVVLVDDPRTVSSSTIGDISVLATYVAGTLAHGSLG